jgi:DNA-binding IclR family transcriptional regulator
VRKLGASVVFDDRETLVLLAVLGGHRTYGDLIAATGVPRGTLHGVLARLRAGGLVTWAEGTQGTIRPTVVVVDVG